MTDMVNDMAEKFKNFVFDNNHTKPTLNQLYFKDNYYLMMLDYTHVLESRTGMYIFVNGILLYTWETK